MYLEKRLSTDCVGIIYFGKFHIREKYKQLINSMIKSNLYMPVGPSRPPWFLFSAAERIGTPLLLSASVSDNFFSGNSPQMAALRRLREIDQSTQRFHVGCWYANHSILLILDDTLNYNLLMWAK